MSFVKLLALSQKRLGLQFVSFSIAYVDYS
jgi:hypothetical protein